MSNNPNDRSDACHHCPAMATIISHVIAHATEQELRVNEKYAQLKKDLEHQTILTAEYRRSYFTIIELLGPDIFKLVADRHRQRDAALETEARRLVDFREAGRLEDFIERIKHAAD